MDCFGWRNNTEKVREEVELRELSEINKKQKKH